MHLTRELALAVVEGRGLDAAGLRADLGRTLHGRSRSGEAPDWPVVSIADLPSSPGIYVISSTQSDKHYVGLALDLRDRFLNEKYGHLAPKNRSRAAGLIDSGTFCVRVPHVLTADASRLGMVELSRREIETYVVLVSAGARVINSLPMLGRIGETAGVPVVLCDCVQGTYAFTDSLAAAKRLVGSSGVMAVVYSYSWTSRGYAARWATTAERELLGDLVGPRGVITDARVAAVVALAGRDVEWVGSGRSAGFNWRAGPLSDEDRSRLARYRRAPYARRASSTFRAVTWSSRNQAWQCRAKSGSRRSDVWQSGRKAWTPLDAAIAREEKIHAEGWEVFNIGRYASNAEAINVALGTKRFMRW